QPQVVRSPPVALHRGRPAPQPPQLVDHRVQALALDELHRVVADLTVLADLEDRHDIGVMQPGRGAGLAAAPLQSRAIPGRLPGQYLERYPAAQRDLLGLVNDSHAPVADLANDPIVADLR